MEQAGNPPGPQRGNESPREAGRSVDLREAYTIYYRRRWLAAIVIIVTVVGVYVGNYLQYPIFNSSVKILVERTSGPEIPFAREQIAFRKSEITETQCQLLLSEPVLSETVRELGLIDRTKTSGGLRDAVHRAWRNFLDYLGRLKERAKQYVIEEVFDRTYTPPTPPDPFRQAVNDLASQVTAEPIPSTDVIRLTVRDHDPQMAARIANQIAEIYLEREVDHQQATARAVYELINNQIKGFMPRYEEAQRRVEQFEERHQARLLEQRIRTQLQEISALEIAYRGAVEDRWSQVRDLRLELARTEQIYSSDHAKVQALQAELNRAEQALRGDTSAAQAQADREGQADAMLDRIREARAELQELTSLEGQYDRLLKVRDREEELYSELRTKREEALMAESVRMAGPRIFENAMPAGRPSAPRKRLNLMIGLLGGIFAAVCICGLLEFLDRSIRTPEQVVRASGIKEVWSVPDRRRPGAVPRRWP
jgi:uncharacterized protein involved in exopolysaccharide biosynthesis